MAITVCGRISVFVIMGFCKLSPLILLNEEGSVLGEKRKELIEIGRASCRERV